MIHCSQIPRILKCPASAQAPDLNIESSSDAAELGTAMHEWIAKYLKQESPDLDHIAAKYEADIEEMTIMKFQFFKIWNTMKEWFPNPELETFMEDEETGICGTLDLRQYTDELVMVVDHKSGWADLDYRAQIMGYCYLAMKKSEAEKAYGAFFWLRLGEIQGAYYTRAQLEDFMAELKAAMGNEDPPFQDGSHCSWCPRLRECPHLSKSITLRDPQIPSTELTVAKVQEYHPIAIRIKKLVEDYETAVRALVRKDGPIPLKDGTELYLNQNWPKKINVAKALNKLYEIFNPEDVMACLKITNTDFDKLSKEKAKAGERKIKDTKEEDWKAIKEAVSTDKPRERMLTRKTKEKLK